MSAPICPYCGERSVFKRDSTLIYRRDYGPVYVCFNYPDCDSYVGCHKGTDQPLGRLANRELRQAKKKAHAQFDRLWKAKMSKGFSKKVSRDAAYEWLAKELGMPAHLTHIGMFDVGTCKRVVEVCLPYSRNLKD